MYLEQCGYFDNGRLMTWLPYQRNQDSSALVHDISQGKLLGDQADKYYAYWYKGPKVNIVLFRLKVDVYCTPSTQYLIGTTGSIRKLASAALHISVWWRNIRTLRKIPAITRNARHAR